jgi:RNA methyltransferase, TrmH family
MLSKNKIKLINGLSLKKNRDELSLFVAEGTKIVKDLSAAYKCFLLIITDEWVEINETIEAEEIIKVTAEEFLKISNQKTPQGVLGVFKKHASTLKIDELTNKLSLVLDDVQDPGNLGTIIRIADWFGITDIICSMHCADAFSPKTTQATMGALANVRVHYVDLVEFLSDYQEKGPIFGTFMDGENIYLQKLSPTGIIVMGNEGNGISESVSPFISKKLLIPNFPFGGSSSESLNVGVATALVCAEFRRRM